MRIVALTNCDTRHGINVLWGSAEEGEQADARTVQDLA
jgi:hypothetical protein